MTVEYIHAVQVSRLEYECVLTNQLTGGFAAKEMNVKIEMKRNGGKYVRLSALLGALLLTGCDRTGTGGPEPNNTTTQTYKVGGYIDRYAHEFRLDDGTRCVAMVNGGVTCQWKSE